MKELDCMLSIWLISFHLIPHILTINSDFGAIAMIHFLGSGGTIAQKTNIAVSNIFYCFQMHPHFLKTYFSAPEINNSEWNCFLYPNFPEGLKIDFGGSDFCGSNYYLPDCDPQVFYIHKIIFILKFFKQSFLIFWRLHQKLNFTIHKVPYLEKSQWATVWRIHPTQM